jgi:biotin operon repressor
MAIIRSARPEAHFSIVDNRVIRDGRLSYKARGILLEILSHADHWRISADDLAAKSPDGRTAVLSGLEELRQAGYIVTTRRQVEGGRWLTESFVYDTPQTLPKSGYPTSDYPTSDNLTPLEEPSKKNHKTANEPDGSRIREAVALYMDNYIGELRPNGGQVGNNIKRAISMGMPLDRIMELIPLIAMAGKELSPGTLRYQARAATTPQQPPTPTPPKYIPEERVDAVPMPPNIRDMIREAAEKARIPD